VVIGAWNARGEPGRSLHGLTNDIEVRQKYASILKTFVIYDPHATVLHGAKGMSDMPIQKGGQL